MSPRPLIAVAGAALLAVLTACGTTTVPGGAQPGTVQSSECAADDTVTSTGPVSLTDSFGRTVELEEPAERIVVLEWQQIEDALTLCVAPVGVADVAGYTTWDTAESLPEGVADVGMRGEPNLDALYATDPDLVIIEAYTAEDEIIGQLEAYDVPVLATKGADTADPIANMIGTFELIAEATGREARAEVVVGEFEQQLEAARAAIEEAAPAETSFVYFDGWIAGGNIAIRPFGQGSLVGELGEALGLENAWDAEVDPAYGLGQTDLEGMTTVEDAWLLYTGTDDPAYDFVGELTKNEIWTSLPAVEDGRTAAFPPGIWTFGGPRSAAQVLDAYVSIVAG